MICHWNSILLIEIFLKASRYDKRESEKFLTNSNDDQKTFKMNKHIVVIKIDQNGI